MFIYWSIKRYEELWRVEDRAQSGCLKSLRAQVAIKIVQEWIRWNLLWKQKIMSQDLNILTRSISRPNRNDQHMRVHCCSREHIFTPALKMIWRTRAECLLEWHTENGHKHFLFTHEKIFTIDGQYNQQNKIYLQTSCEVKENVLRVLRGHHPSYVMVWCEVSHQEVTHHHFHMKGVKLVSEYIKRACYKEMWNILT